ncbi:hypothetical protein [Desulfosporosinus sp. SB140]|uniref:hypothetical protein n=1 Tax=Desulfosporosinus paludis TaxID=3115649 RepID=UPI00388D3961
MIRKWNDWLAAKITQGMATMWCAYAFLFWSLIPLVFPAAQSVVFYVSGGIIQLVALSLIMVGQDVLGRGSIRQAKETHDVVMIEREMLKKELYLANMERKETKHLHQLALKELIELKELNKKISGTEEKKVTIGS